MISRLETVIQYFILELSIDKAWAPWLCRNDSNLLGPGSIALCLTMLLPQNALGKVARAHGDSLMDLGFELSICPIQPHLLSRSDHITDTSRRVG